MPTSKPDENRISLLKDRFDEICQSVSLYVAHVRQDLYTEQLQGNFREERFLELGKKAGIKEKQIERHLSTGKVLPASFT